MDENSKNITIAINEAVEDLYNIYKVYPYKHRVEHSLHCELFSLIKEKLIENNVYSIINNNNFQTQIIHKEWPHDYKPKEDRNRGNYDLVVLSGKSLEKCTLKEYKMGRNIEILSIIELGLNYGIKHLNKDVNTLKMSQNANKWIIHFLNRSASKKAASIMNNNVNELIKQNSDISFAYCWINEKDKQIIGDRFERR